MRAWLSFWSGDTLQLMVAQIICGHMSNFFDIYSLKHSPIGMSTMLKEGKYRYIFIIAMLSLQIDVGNGNVLGACFQLGTSQSRVNYVCYLEVYNLGFKSNFSETFFNLYGWFSIAHFTTGISSKFFLHGFFSCPASSWYFSIFLFSLESTLLSYRTAKLTIWLFSFFLLLR